MGLLDHITATSLDADYAAAAQRRAEQDPGGRPGRPGRVALEVLAVFGVLVATAGVQTARTAEESASSRSSLIKQANDGKARLAARRSSLRALERQVATLGKMFGWAFAIWGIGLYWWAGLLYAWQVRKLLADRDRRAPALDGG